MRSLGEELKGSRIAFFHSAKQYDWSRELIYTVMWSMTSKVKPKLLKAAWGRVLIFACFVLWCLLLYIYYQSLWWNCGFRCAALNKTVTKSRAIFLGSLGFFNCIIQFSYRNCWWKVHSNLFLGLLSHCWWEERGPGDEDILVSD